MGQYKLKITNNTNSVLFVRGYTSSTKVNEWHTLFPDGIANSTDLKLTAEEFTHELQEGESYEFVMAISPSGIYDATAYENVGFAAAICCSASNDLPESTYAYFSRNNLSQVSLNLRYTNATVLSSDYVAKGGFYKTITGRNIRAITGSNEQTITNVVIGNAQAVVNASSWWMNIIPATADIIMNNALVSIVFFVLLVSITLKKITPKLFAMIEDKDAKKRRKRRNSPYGDDSDDF